MVALVMLGDWGSFDLRVDIPPINQPHRLNGFAIFMWLASLIHWWVYMFNFCISPPPLWLFPLSLILYIKTFSKLSFFFLNALIWKIDRENDFRNLGVMSEVPVVRVQADVMQYDSANAKWVPCQGSGPSVVHLYQSLARILNLAYLN